MLSPKTTLKFNDLLGGLTELRKAVILVVMVYYIKGIQIKIRNGKGHIMRSPEETRHKLPIELSQQSHLNT